MKTIRIIPCLFLSLHIISADVEELFIVGTIAYDDVQGGGYTLKDAKGGCGSLYDLGQQNNLHHGMHGLFHIRRRINAMGPRKIGMHAEIISYKENLRLRCCLL